MLNFKSSQCKIQNSNWSWNYLPHLNLIDHVVVVSINLLNSNFIQTYSADLFKKWNKEYLRMSLDLPRGGQMWMMVQAGLLVQKSGLQIETWSSKPSWPNFMFMAQFYPCTQVSLKIALKYHSPQSRRPLKDALLSTCLIMQLTLRIFSLSFMATILSGSFPSHMYS